MVIRIASAMSPMKLILALLFLLLPPSLPAAAPPVTRQTRFQEAQRLFGRANQLRNEGKAAAAASMAFRAIEILRPLLGPADPRRTAALEFLASLQEASGDFAGAVVVRMEIRAFAVQTHGASHWQTIDADLALAHTRVLQRLNESQRRRLAAASTSFRQAVQLANSNRADEALPLLEKALAIRENILGAAHLDVALCLDWIGSLHLRKGTLEKAEIALERSRRIREKLQGGDHPTLANNLLLLSDVLVSRKDDPCARTLLSRVLAIRRRTLGPRHASTLQALQRLLAVNERIAERRENAEDFPPAILLRREAFEAQVLLAGSRHWHTREAHSRLRQAEILASLPPSEIRRLREANELLRQGTDLANNGKSREALEAIRKSLAIYRAVVGPGHLSCAACHGWLGMLLGELKDPARAEVCLHDALAVTRELLGEDHPNYAACLAQRAALDLVRAPERAARLYRTVLAIRESALGRTHPTTLETVGDLAGLYDQQADRLERDGKVEDLLIARRRLVDLVPQLRGPIHWQTIDARLALAYAERLQKLPENDRQRLTLARNHSDRAEALDEKSEFSEALWPASHALLLRSELLGTDHPKTAYSAHLLGSLFRKLGANDCAEPIVRQGLRVRQAYLGDSHPHLGNSVNELGLLFDARGDDAAAVPLFREAAAVYRKAEGEKSDNHFQVLDNLLGSLNKLAGKQEADGHFAGAIRSRQEVAEIREQRLGPKHWQTVDARLAVAHTRRLLGLSEPQRGRLRGSRQLLARVREHDRLGQAGQAHKPAQEAWQIARELLGEEDTETLDALSWGSWTAEAGGDLVTAERLGKRYVQQNLTVRGPDHPGTASALNRLGLVYRGRGELKQAETLLRQAMDIRRRVLGEAHLDYAMSLNNVAQVCQERSDYKAAEPLYQKALQTLATAGKQETFDQALVLLSLGSLYRDRGEFDRAEKLYLQALALRRKLGGESHPLCGDSLAHLGILYRNEVKYPDAEKAFRQALDLRKRCLGERHADYASSLSNLGGLYRLMGNLERAGPLLREALRIREEVLGKEHIDVAESLHRLGLWHQDRAEDAKAESCLRRALAMRTTAWGKDALGLCESLEALASVRSARGDYVEAERLLLQSAEIRKKKQGMEHSGYALVLTSLSLLYRERADFIRAENLQQQAYEIRKKALGEDSVECTVNLHNLALIRRARGDYPGAVILYRQVGMRWASLLGKKHPHYARSLASLAMVYHDQGKYAEAGQLWDQVLEIREAVLGRGHPEYVSALLERGELFQAQGNFDRADRLYRQAWAIEEARGDVSSSVLSHRAGLYVEKGDFAAAEPLFRENLTKVRARKGEKHPSYAKSLQRLASLYMGMGDARRAEVLLRQALRIQHEVWGEWHLDCSATLTALALLHDQREDYTRADALHLRAHEINRRVLGETHRNFAVTATNLAGVYRRKGQYRHAEELLRQALALTRKALHPDHPDTVWELASLASLCRLQKRPDEAEALIGQARDILERSLGKDHPDAILILANQAMLRQCRTDLAGAAQLLREGLLRSRRHLDRSCLVLSERQQLALLRSQRFLLDAYVSLGLQGAEKVEALYDHVLAWKGAAFVRQRHLREMRNVQRELPDADAARLFKELQSTGESLARFALAPPGSRNADWRREIDRLTEKKERLEADLAGRSAAFRRYRAEPVVNAERIRSALPDNVALIDFLELRYFGPDAFAGPQTKGERHLTAFVIRNGLPIQCIDLGPAQPIERAIAGWRSRFSGDGPRRSPISNPEGELRRMWEKLEPAVQGVSCVLVSPDGALNRFPLAALPGRKPGTYLIEERSVAVVPVPLFLAESRQRHTDRADSGALVVGDVAFDARPAGSLVAHRAPARGADGLRFPALPGTKREMDAVQALFRRTYPASSMLRLQKDEATRSAFCASAPGRRYLHLATHGFFAARETTSSLSPTETYLPGEQPFISGSLGGWHPGLLSGLAFAGAGRPAGSREEGGVLTALEVAGLDLESADLVVLSACETGLGVSAGGEGLLGLQRAFQVAGARTVVASLWSVDDRATEELMTRFYLNHWRLRMPPLEALRQAQLSILRGQGESGPSRGSLQRVDERGPARVHPRLWAAWVLSGDPGELGVAKEADRSSTTVSMIDPYEAVGGLSVVLLLVAWTARRATRSHSLGHAMPSR